MAQKYLFIAILCAKMSCVNKALTRKKRKCVIIDSNIAQIIFLPFERTFVFTIFLQRFIQPKIKIEKLKRNNNDFTLFLPLSLKHEVFVLGRGPAKINICLSCKQAFTLANANFSKKRMN